VTDNPQAKQHYYCVFVSETNLPDSVTETAAGGGSGGITGM